VIAYESERVIASLRYQLQESPTAFTSEALDDGWRGRSDELWGDDTRARACCTGTHSMGLQYDASEAPYGRMECDGQPCYTPADDCDIGVRIATKWLRRRSARS